MIDSKNFLLLLLSFFIGSVLTVFFLDYDNISFTNTDWLTYYDSKSDFLAMGEETFVPPSTTHTNSGFIFEEVSLGGIKLQTGGRLDYQNISVDKVASFENVRSRDDLTGSASLGFVYNLPKDYAAALSTSYTERAPNAQELYANGEHLSTETFEVGNQDLDVQNNGNCALYIDSNLNLSFVAHGS